MPVTNCLVSRVMVYYVLTYHHGGLLGQLRHGSARTTAVVRRAIQQRRERVAKRAKRDDENRCQCWPKEPERFIRNPYHGTLGLNI